jgi:hypothetical protein
VLSREITVLLFAALLMAAKPYEDTRHRFRVELPDTWTLTPQFGDTSGMVFQRSIGVRQRQTVATLIIHVDSAPASDAKEYADAHEKALRAQPSFERKSESAVTVGGHAALVREYRALAAKKPKIEKTIRAHFFEAVGHRYLIHIESPSRDFAKVEEDLAKILTSFKPMAGSAEKNETAIKIEGLEATPVLNGRWVNDDGLLMVLGGDGSFALAEATGRYEVRDGVLTMIIPGQGRESFNFLFDGVAGTLTLSSENLGTPMVYRRAGPGSGKSKKSDENTALTGRWITPTANGPLVLELRADKTFSMGSSSGQWSSASNRLTLIKSGSQSVTYTFTREGDRLALSGGDLEVEVVFSR